ncbi:MAG: hypothetical protein R3296_14185 [Oleiphilaceae bacterium]|nr:hypothetical protein [Oleiphilaceae bacterium]
MSTSNKTQAVDNGLQGQWCQTLTLQPGQTLVNELSGLHLSVTLLDHEWQLRTERVDRDVEDSHWHQRISHETLPDDSSLQRFIRSREAPRLTFRPALADRSMVIRPYNTLQMGPDASCTIYLSTVLWLQVLVGDAQRLLTEIPIMPPSSTWMGPNTMEGEICYAGKTYARMLRESLPMRPWRAITPVHIRNRGQEPLAMERLSLPVPLLPLYQQKQVTPGEAEAAGGNPWLWTPEVTVTCEKSLATASLALGQGAPVEAGPCTLVAGARENAGKGTLVRHIDRLFG